MVFMRNLLLLLLCFGLFAGCEGEKSNSNERTDMILDTLNEADAYMDLHPGFAKAFEFLRQESLADLQPGRYELVGDSLYCMISKGPGKSREEARLEAHRKYIDIQFVISGDEEMGWRPTEECTKIAEPYSEEKDIMFFDNPAKMWKTVPPGSFVIFYPKDAHAPMVGDGEIHKVVCKVLKEF